MYVEKLKSVGRWFLQADVAGQGLAQLPKFGISLVSTELGNKVWNALIGAAGNVLNEKFGGRRKELLRALFTNMMFSVFDPTANQIRELERNYHDLVGGLKMRNFSTAFGALVEEPQEVVGAIRSVIPKFKGFKVPSLGTFKNTMLGSDRAIQEVTPDLVTKFQFGDPLADSDIVEY